MSATAPDPDLPDWLGHWSLKALVPVALAAGYVRLADAPLLEPAVFVAVFEAMLLFTQLEDAGYVAERAAKLASGVVALAGAGLLVVALDDGVFVSALVSVGLISFGRAAVPDWEWSTSLDHPFSARRTDESTGDTVRDGVLSALADRPHTRRELWETVDADAEAIDEAVATLQAEETITRAGSEFRLEGSA